MRPLAAPKQQGHAMTNFRKLVIATSTAAVLAAQLATPAAAAAR